MKLLIEYTEIGEIVHVIQLHQGIHKHRENSTVFEVASFSNHPVPSTSFYHFKKQRIVQKPSVSNIQLANGDIRIPLLPTPKIPINTKFEFIGLPTTNENGFECEIEIHCFPKIPDEEMGALVSNKTITLQNEGVYVIYLSGPLFLETFYEIKGVQ